MIKEIPGLIIKEIIKIFRETLQGIDLKYSSKNIMVAQAFLLCAAGYIFETWKTGRVNMLMFDVFMGAAFGTSIVSTASNLIHKKIDNPSPGSEIININDADTSNINIDTQKN